MSNPMDDISAEVGTIVGQYRAVLDQLIYSLIELRTGNRPNGRPQFPICGKSNDFQARTKPNLKGLQPADIAAIEKLQPYNGALWTRRIKQLAEDHKHRKLIELSGGQATFHGHSAILAVSGFLRTPSGSGVPRSVNVESRVSGPFTFKDDGTPLIETLEMFQAEVLATLDAFKPHFDAVDTW